MPTIADNPVGVVWGSLVLQSQITLPVRSGNRLPIKNRELALLKLMFPLVDVEAELKELGQILECNPALIKQRSATPMYYKRPVFNTTLARTLRKQPFITTILRKSGTLDMKKIITAIILATAAMSSNSAFAGGELTRSHIYIGAGGGLSTESALIGARTKDYAFELNYTQKRGFANQANGNQVIHYGVSVVSYLFSPAEPTPCGDGECDSDSEDVEDTPDAPDWNAYLRVGYGNATTSYSTATPSNNSAGLYFGGGVEYELSRNVSFRLEENKFDRALSSNHVVGSEYATTICVLRHF